MERESQDQHDLLHVTLESIPDAVVATNEAGRVEILNKTAEALLGWTRAEAVGMPVEEVLELRGRRGETGLANPANCAVRQGAKIEKTGEFLLVSRDRRRLPIEISAAPIHNASGTSRGCVFVFRDVSVARQLADRMSYHAHHDPLTGLPNRILLVDRLEQGTRMADRGNDRMAVMFLDLDNFKEINDAHGSAMGDELLKEASRRLRAALRESDTVCRLGGDEFVVMLPGIKLGEDIEGVAAKLLAEIAKPFRLREKAVQTSCSIGVSVYPQDGRDVGTLMRLADAAMYEAKRNGRNRYLFARTGTEPVEPGENAEDSDSGAFISDPYDR